MRYILLILLLLINASCSAAQVIRNIDTSIKGTASDEVEVSVFNGEALKPAGKVSGKFIIETGVTPGYFGAAFFTKEGFYPKTVLFKAQDRPVSVGTVALKKTEDTARGVLAGIIYTPASGGKLEEHTGIFRVFKGIEIDIARGSVKYIVKTDDSGAFMVLLPEGEYTLSAEGKVVGSAAVRSGETTIKDIRKGLVLID